MLLQLPLLCLSLKFTIILLKLPFPVFFFPNFQVGNEILTVGNPNNGKLVPAMRNVYRALKAVKLHTRIKVVSPCGAWIVQNTYPPSESILDNGLQTYTLDMLKFLNDTGTPENALTPLMHL